MQWTNYDLKDRHKLNVNALVLLDWIEMFYELIMKPYKCKICGNNFYTPETEFVNHCLECNHYYELFSKQYLRKYEIKISIKVIDYDYKVEWSAEKWGYNLLNVKECRLKCTSRLIGEKNIHTFRKLDVFTKYLADNSLYNKVTLKLEKEVVRRS